MTRLIMGLLFVFLAIVKSEAQNFQGTAIYSSKRQMGDFDIKSEGMSPEMLDQIKEKMAKAFEKSYVLNFNMFESVYQEEEKLKTPSGNSAVDVVTVFSGSDRSKMYKNFKEKKYISEEDIFGKEFLIIDSLPKMNWIMLDEQKKIGNYTCFKAKIIIPVTDEEKKEREALLEKQKKNKTAFMVSGDLKERVIEAWYTLDIPVSNGPDKYWGLPGLILELHENETIYLCSKIILNTEEDLKIKAPKTGKKVSQNEFDIIKEERLKKMMNDDGVIEIKINN